MKNQKNNILAFVLLGVLFMWSVNLQNKQAEEEVKAQKEAKAKAAVEVVQADSVEEVKPVTSLKKPGLVPLTSKKDTVVAPIDSVVVDSAVVDSMPKPTVVLPRKITLETKHFIVEFDNKGAVITSLILKELKNEEGEFPQLLEYPEKGILDLSLDKVDFSSSLFEINEVEDHVKVTSAYKLSFTWKGEEGVEVIRHYLLDPDSRSIKHELEVKNYQVREYELKSFAGLKETEKAKSGGFGLANYDFSELVFKRGAEVNREIIKEQTVYEKDEEGMIEWVGVRRKYVAALIDFNRTTDIKLVGNKVNSQDERYNPTYTYSIQERMIPEGLNFDLTILPLEYNNVKAHKRGYEKLIWSGWNFLGANKWFPALCGLILSLLNWLYGVLGNFGVGIIILTLLVKTVTLPLMISQTRSMKKMAQHKPALDELRKKYSGDPKKYQEEMMKYYKEKGINPMASMLGCLPMFIQMPVFFSLFIVFSRTMELRGAPFFGWITDLSSPDILTTAITLPFIMPEGLSLLPFLMAYTTFVQTKQSMTDPNMKGMVYIMPLMMFTFSGVMPSGLVLYWIVSNLFTIVQYKVIGSPATRAATAETK